MNSPHILALSTGVPGPRYTQQEICQQFAAYQQVPERRARAMQAIFERSGVGFRHFMVPRDFYAVERSTAERNQLYMPEAISLGAEVITQLLQTSGYDSHDIDDFIVVSCTGHGTPGLDLHLAGHLQMRPNLRRASILGMGCYGAFPGLHRAAETARADRLVLVLCIELCSLHLQINDMADNVVSTALFADGAGAVLLGGERQTSRLPRMIGSATFCDYTTLDQMTFTLTDHGFQMYLSSYVPDLLSSQVKAFVDHLLENNGLSRERVRLWGIHPGSTKIVDYVQKQLDLTDEQVESSHRILYEYGNMSSVTILFVLEDLIACQHPEVGDYGVLLAFGPGLTMEAMLLQW